MARPQPENFGSPEALLKYIQERSDDIEKAVIYPPGVSLCDADGRQMAAPFKFFTMFFVMVNGETKVARDGDAEMILNDGILNRMKIKIEFFKEQ